jgi:NTE family protein
VPGLLPPVVIEGEHFLDGGLVHSIPVGRAVALGAETVYVLHVGRIEQPLTAPQRPWQVATVAFEIARRHRFFEDMSTLGGDVKVHVLPAGADGPSPKGDLSPLRYRDASRIDVHIQRAYKASVSYLESIA